MSNHHPEENEASHNEYSEIFAKLAAEEDAEAKAENPDPSLETDETAVEAEISNLKLEIEQVVASSEIASPRVEAIAAESETEVPHFPSETDDIEITASRAELKPAIEAILFVADEPVPFNQLCKILGDVNSADAYAAIVELMSDYEARGSGLELREIAGGWRISTRPQHHEFIRKYLKSKPSARLSLPALETLAVIAYKQPVTVPEVLEIRGVSSSSAIKTLLEKRLIVTKGRKETVGRPMMYGTSKEFLIQFGLRDLNELPSIEDFEELAA